MTGETNLDQLIKAMDPVLHHDTFVFVTFSDSVVPNGLETIMTFREKEGLTAIATLASAEATNTPFEFPCRMITLNIHSALDAVGFLARITTALAVEEMGVNPVSGFYHDHLFVPQARADDAMRVLNGMREE